MSDEQKEFELETPAEGAATGLPKELEGKTPAEIWAMVEAEKGKTGEAIKARERAEAIAQEIAMAALDGRRVAVPETKKQDVSAPDKEADPDAWMAYEIERRVDAKLKPLADNYAKDRQMVMGGMFESAKSRVAGQFPDWSEHEAAINEFLKNFPAEVLAQPGAIEEAYFRVKGRATHAKEVEARVREQATMGAGGRVGVGEKKEEAPKFSDDTLHAAAALGTDLTGFTMFKEGNSFSIDEYLAAKAKNGESKTKGGPNAAR